MFSLWLTFGFYRRRTFTLTNIFAAKFLLSIFIYIYNNLCTYPDSPLHPYALDGTGLHQALRVSSSQIWLRSWWVVQEWACNQSDVPRCRDSCRDCWEVGMYSFLLDINLGEYNSGVSRKREDPTHKSFGSWIQQCL